MCKPAAPLALAGICLTALVSPLEAEIPLSDGLFASGFMSGSYLVSDLMPGPSVDHFGLDSTLLSLRYAAAPAGAVISLYHTTTSSPESTVLDGYLTLESGGGLTLTAGKFQSVIGYEAFHPVDNPTISFANNELLAIAPPSYHTGLKLEYARDIWGAGAAFLDCLYTSPSYDRGDGELKVNQGYEAFLTFRGGRGLVVNASVGREGHGLHGSGANESWVYDLWATYELKPGVQLAADWAQKDGGPGDKGYNWLFLVDHELRGNLSAAVRVSGEYLQGGGRFTRYTVAPSLKLKGNLTLRAEYSHTDYRNAPQASVSSVGLQAFVKF